MGRLGTSWRDLGKRDGGDEGMRVLGRSWRGLGEVFEDLAESWRQKVKKIALAISDYRPGEAKSVIRITFLRVPAEQERGSLQLLLNHVATILGPSWAILGPS